MKKYFSAWFDLVVSLCITNTSLSVYQNNQIYVRAESFSKLWKLVKPCLYGEDFCGSLVPVMRTYFFFVQVREISYVKKMVIAVRHFLCFYLINCCQCDGWVFIAETRKCMDMASYCQS